MRARIISVFMLVCLLTGCVDVRALQNQAKEPAGNVMAGSDTNADDLVEVHFIDVGQGDATLIKAAGHYMLIDAGENDKGTAVQLYLQKQGVDKLDYLILTHADSDHIGGADVIISKFDIDTIFFGDYYKTNSTYKDVVNAMEYREMTYSIPTVGEEYSLGNATFTILAPNKTYDNANNSSIALLLRNGDNTFLFTGDCEEEAEFDILANGMDIDCDVYKLGHHGSSDASHPAFLEAITPAYGVISCGEGNDYGHPHAEPLNNLRALGVQIFRTDEQGSIIAYSDGAQITWSCATDNNWQAGEAIGTSPTENLQSDYVIGNKNSRVFHRPTCNGLPKEKNRVIFNSREEALAAGYDNPCNYCKP